MPRGSRRGTQLYPMVAPTPIARFDLGQTTFTPNLAKRPGQGPFDAAPMISGAYDMTGTPDALGYARGTLLGNQVQQFYSNFDPYQGTILVWCTPEVSSAALTSGYFYLWYVSASYYARYSYSANQFEYVCGGQTVTRATAITAGTTYYISCSWNTTRTIDGTNYIRNGLNDAYAYGATTKPTASAPDAEIWFGRNAILEGLSFYRRILYDGTYGTPPVDGADELAAIYAAGAGLDPQRVTGAWDCVLCIPTNCQTNEALDTGTGEAWSMPHGSSNLPDVWAMSDGDPPGTPYAVEFNGTSTYVNCGSGATIDNLPSGGVLTVGIWVRMDASASNFCAIGKASSAGTDGWRLLYNAGSDAWIFRVELATTSAIATWDLETIVADGKLHYVVGYYDDATKTARVAYDGKWDAANVGAGAYVADAGSNLYVGTWNLVAGWYLTGGVAWWEIWNNDHHTAGTNFIPPRVPSSPGGALVETWWADEGSGVTVAARVTTPANDGTITSGSWSRLWEQEGTPVLPISLEFEEYSGIGPWVSVGSGATIDDLHAGANGFTAEGWFCIKSSLGIDALAGKRYGWSLGLSGGGQPRAYVYYSVTNAVATATIDMVDGTWHHLAMCYNENTDRKIYLFLDGVLVAISAASAGVATSDAAGLGTFFDSGWVARTPNGHIGWQHWSDTVRYTGTTLGKKYFNPPGRPNIPGADGNSMGHWAFTDGAGTAVADTSGNANNGAITGSVHTWRNTCDMTYDSPMERNHQNGYAIGSDGAGDGLTIIENAQVTAGNSYVIRCTLSVGMSGRAKPYLLVYDNIGAANILASFPYPFMTGTHDGANNAATLQDSTARWVYNFVGWSLYNVTDGSSTTVTANTQTTQTGVLAGGTDNDWDTGDVYSLMPPGNRSYSRYPVQETVVVTAPAGCTSMDVKLLNSAGEGVMHVHQVEMYPSLLTNGDYEAGAGAPWIPTGWTATYVAGEGIQELATIHSGASAVEIVSTAATRYLYVAPGSWTHTAGKYYTVGCWTYGNGAGVINQGDANGAVLVFHSQAAAWSIACPTTARWSETRTVRRHAGGFPAPSLQILTSAAGSRFLDDYYVVLLNDVSLTAYPANYANSLEAPGIRVCGYGTLTQPIPGGTIRPNKGIIRWSYTPRHPGAVALEFNTTPFIAAFIGAGSNYIQVYWAGVNQIRLAFNNGGGEVSGIWNTGGTFFLADVTHQFEVWWNAAEMRLSVDGVVRVTVSGTTGFASIPSTAWWGTTNAVSNLNGDAIFSAY